MPVSFSASFLPFPSPPFVHHRATVFASYAFAFSLAIPPDPITNISFSVVWQRDSSDPTSFLLDRQYHYPPPIDTFGGGGYFASVNGTLGDSVDPQTTSLKVATTFIMYGIVTDSAATSTFYISFTFTVYSPDQAASTNLITTETSFPATPASASVSASITSSHSGITTDAGSSAATSSSARYYTFLRFIDVKFNSTFLPV
ncbi:hypothetical protein J3R30DRAFT_3697881 [Lentinula aciculospora]|uniref:Uncharacterized protein n=1 Tax=Lentinula aciculospora TaxID=153920 RepID=A0A9W9ANW6_9AGAR|nr:hypothetical protein J3R30DRAFT_3697881 [Lentinula aciculospora]